MPCRRTGNHQQLSSTGRIVLYKDGLTDAFDSRGELLKIEDLENFARETSMAPFSDMREGILNRIAVWRDGPLVERHNEKTCAAGV